MAWASAAFYPCPSSLRSPSIVGACGEGRGSLFGGEEGGEGGLGGEIEEKRGQGERGGWGEEAEGERKKRGGGGGGRRE